MKYLRVFDSVSEMETVLANSTIGVVGLAYNGSTPVVKLKLPSPDPKTIPFYIENPTSSSVTTTISKNDFSAPTLTIEKSTDRETWTTLGTTSTSALSIEVPANSKVYLRCNTKKWASDYYYNKIAVGSSCNVGGNIMSLLYGSNFTGDEISFPSGSTDTFNSIFINSGVVNAKDLLLPATTLANFCYNSMFYDCTSLTAAPELPATTLKLYCYYRMFEGCTSLTAAPVLPATTLAEYCYDHMFKGCTSLTTAPALPATTLIQNCYQDMFVGCTSLTTAPELPATTLAYGCYTDMFTGCTSLATAPALPATTLAQYCYYYMFNGCTSLNDVTIYANDISATYCLFNWLNGVARTGTFHNLGNASYPSGASGIPSGWTEVHS